MPSSAPSSPSLSATATLSSSSSSSSSSPSTPIPPPPQAASARFAREYSNNRPSISTVIGSPGHSAPTTPTMEQASPHVFVLPSAAAAAAAKGKAQDGARPSSETSTSGSRPSSPKPAPVVFGSGINGRPQLRGSPGSTMPTPILRSSATVALGANHRSIGPGGPSSTPAPAVAPSLRGYTASEWSLLAIQRTPVGLLITLQHRPSEALFAWPMNTVGGTQSGPGQVYIMPKSPDPQDAPASTTTSWSLRVLGDVVSAWVRGPGKQASASGAGRAGLEGSSGKRRLGEHEGDVMELARQLGLYALPDDERRSALARQKIKGVTVIHSPATTPGARPEDQPRRNEAAATALAEARKVAPTRTRPSSPPATAPPSAPAPASPAHRDSTSTDKGATLKAKTPRKKESFSALRALKGLRPSSAAGLVSSMTSGGTGVTSRRESRRTASSAEIPSVNAAVTNSGSSSSASSIGSIFSTTKRPSSSRTGSTSSAVSSIPTIEIRETGDLVQSTTPAFHPPTVDASSPVHTQAAKERSPRPFSLTAWNSSASSLLKGSAGRARRGSSNSSIATATAVTSSVPNGPGQRSDSVGRSQISV